MLSLSLETTILGRPRDMWSCRLSASAVGDCKRLKKLGKGGYLSCITVVSSQGSVSVFSTELLLAAGVKEHATPDDNKAALECALLARHQIKVEPRLTAVVAWSDHSSENNEAEQNELSEKVSNDANDPPDEIIDVPTEKKRKISFETTERSKKHKKKLQYKS